MKGSLKCKFAQNCYGGYCIPVSSIHRPAARIVSNGGVYEKETIDFIRKYHDGGDIVHAGTYFGDFLPGISKACSSEQRIWAFEPNPESFHCAEVTILLNKIKNVCLKNGGLGNVETSMVFETSDKIGKPLGGGSYFNIGASRIGDKNRVPIFTIDNEVPKDRTVSIIQLDVEGCEEIALIGGIKTIERCKPILILEVNPKSRLLTGEFFKKTIIGMGYKKIRKIHSNIVYSVR